MESKELRGESGASDQRPLQHTALTPRSSQHNGDDGDADVGASFSQSSRRRESRRILCLLFIAPRGTHTHTATTRLSLFLSSLLVTAVSAGVTRNPTTTTTTTTTPTTTTPTTDTITTATATNTTAAATEEVKKREEEAAEKEEEEEERRVGVNGWLAAPTQSPSTSTQAPPKQDKPGICESPKGFGIKCMTRMDQCQDDHTCPGGTKCCLVGECGLLCVKPKPTSTDTAKVVTKEGTKKNKKEGAKEGNKQEAKQEEEEEAVVKVKENGESKQQETKEKEKQGTEEEVAAEDQGSGDQATPKTPAQRTVSEKEENVTSATPTEDSA
ncbi:integumentary mucin C.1-like [Eriocheir sinensis]|uniref:integumentary mucin C.1-like n=1 Tax=Eriocheir sinensis TaxID=95602 RepID=UPI0021C7C77D|nr:integumentary mucin C.1-like [Eriocheir sinensis]